MAQIRKLRRAVIKEELVALTGDSTKAVILNQLIYWQERTRDLDSFIQEEKERCKKSGTAEPVQLTRGWFYKRAAELATETMLKLSPSNILLHIARLTERGWVLERHNPHHKWDRTKQYRVDLLRVKADLERIGYTLEGWTELPISITEDASSKTENGSSDIEHRPSETELRDTEIEVRNPPLERAIPKITPETTTETITQIPPLTPPTVANGPNGGEALNRKENGNGTENEPGMQPDGTAIAGKGKAGRDGVDASAVLGLIGKYLDGEPGG